MKAKGNLVYRHTYVDVSAGVTSAQVVQYRSFVEVGQVSHVFNFLEFRGIHLLNRILLNVFLLQTQHIFVITSLVITAKRIHGLPTISWLSEKKPV